MSNIEKVVALAAQQHGIFAAFQLKEIGITQSSFYRVVNNALFTRLDRGVYALSGSQKSWYRDAIVHVFRSGPHALLSHESALINRGLLLKEFVSKRNGLIVPFHVTIPRESGRRLSTSIHRSIYEKEILTRTVVNNIPQVSVECAIIESARHIPPQIFSSVVDSAIRQEYTSARKLRLTLDALWPAPGRSKSRVEEIIHGYLADPRTYKRIESTLEARIYRVLSEITREQIIPQYLLACGTKQYRIDFAIPSFKIAIEVDGFIYHSDRIAFDADKTRQNDIVAEGWIILRFTHMQSDDEIRAQFNRLLQRWAS